MVRLLMPLILLISFCFSQIGTLNTFSGANIKYFTTSPGSKGKPGTNVTTVSGKIFVYEVFDWSLLDIKLSNQKGHVWYRVSSNCSYWIYGVSNFLFKEIK